MLSLRPLWIDQKRVYIQSTYATKVTSIYPAWFLLQKVAESNQKGAVQWR